MAAQAQRVGFDIKHAQTLSNEILEGGLEEAVKRSSELQALGGNIGALGDPGQLYRMAMYDIEGLQDELIKASSSAVDFNETTGDFKIGGEEMLRLRQQAKILGLTYEEVAKGAINARKEQEIMSRVGSLSNLTEEQRGLVSSLAEIGPGGQISIDLPNFDEAGRDLATLMNDNGFINALNEYNKNMGKSEGDIQLEMVSTAKSSLSVQEQMKNTLIAIQNQGIKTLEGKGTGTKMIEGLRQQTGGPGTDTETIFNNLKNNIDTQISGINTEFTNFYLNLKTITTSFVDISIRLSGTLARILKSTILNTSSTEYDPTTPAVTIAFDAFVPAGGGKMVSGSFGQFLGDTKDDILLSPGIGDFFNKYNESENILKSIGGPKSGGDLSLLYKNATAQPSQNLVDLLTKSSSFSPTNTEIKQTVEIGGKTEVTLNINTNIPQNLISQVLDASQLKETIMTTVNTRLSAEYSDKLSNAFITQKRE
jgi:hypothetical protein